MKWLLAIAVGYLLRAIFDLIEAAYLNEYGEGDEQIHGGVV